jgi:hypothetical protein
MYAEREPTSQDEIRTVENVLDFARKNRIPVPQDITHSVGSNLLQIATGRTPQLAMSAHQALEIAASLRSYIDPRAKTIERQSILITNVEYSVFNQSILEGFRIKLDTNQYIDSVLKNCTVIYNGGPVVLQNTGFTDCDFEFSDVPAARQLLVLFTQRSDPDFSFKADELPPPNSFRPPPVVP